MNTTGKSTLLHQTGKMVGSGFARHPQKPGWSMNVVVYKTDDQWVICLAELEGGGDPEAQRANLGSLVPGSLFAPYAARGIGAEMPYEELRRILDKSLPLSLPGIDLLWLASV